MVWKSWRGLRIIVKGLETHIETRRLLSKGQNEKLRLADCCHLRARLEDYSPKWSLINKICDDKKILRLITDLTLLTQRYVIISKTSAAWRTILYRSNPEKGGNAMNCTVILNWKSFAALGLSAVGIILAVKLDSNQAMEVSTPAEP